MEREHSMNTFPSSNAHVISMCLANVEYLRKVTKSPMLIPQHDNLSLETWKSYIKFPCVMINASLYIQYNDNFFNNI